jgi:hypothetical protein
MGVKREKVGSSLTWPKSSIALLPPSQSLLTSQKGFPSAPLRRNSPLLSRRRSRCPWPPYRIKNNLKVIDKNKGLAISANPCKSSGVPKGIRTPVTDVKGRCPWPARRWGPSQISNVKVQISNEIQSSNFKVSDSAV